MARDISYKNFFIKYGFFAGVFAVILFLCVYTTLVSKKYWNKNLSANVLTVLTERTGDEWSFVEPVEIQNPFALNCAAFVVKNKAVGKNYTSIIVRINSMYGPIPAVFLVDDKNNVSFVDYSNIHGTVKNQIEFEKYNNRIELYKARIPSILGLEERG